MRRPLAAIALVALAVSTLGVLPAGASATITNGTLTSFDGTAIGYTLFKPASASTADPAPVIIHSHGWAGSRTTSGMTEWTDAGYGVLSFDQRGFGASGGEANVQDPDIEGRDISMLIDFIAGLPWVALDGPGDPVLGAIGASYGGGFQLIGALTEIRNTGSTRFNALSPEITWNNLPRALAPQGVPRTLWDTALYAAGAKDMPSWIHPAYAAGLATATFPDGSIPGIDNLTERFYAHSPAWFAANGMKLDIPVLFRQGISDNLFVLNEAWHNYNEVLTPAAREASIVIGYNGGHVLPSVYPAGIANGASACTNWVPLQIAFFDAAFSGGDTGALQPNTYNLDSATGSCIRTDSLDNYTTYPVGIDGTVATAAASAGAPVAFKIADGPLTVAGVARLRGSLTTVGVDARAYFALSVGVTAADARILQNNVAPLRQFLPADGADLDFELVGVAAEIGAGESLFLTVSPATDMFIGTGSRAPAAIVINDAVVDVPLV